MPNAKVYGKRTTARGQKSAQLFQPSPIPANESMSPARKEGKLLAPSQKFNDEAKPQVVSIEEAQHHEQGVLDVTAETLGRLCLDDGEPAEHSIHSLAASVQVAQPLRPRDANVVPTTPGLNQRKAVKLKNRTEERSGVLEELEHTIEKELKPTAVADLPKIESIDLVSQLPQDSSRPHRHHQNRTPDTTINRFLPPELLSYIHPLSCLSNDEAAATTGPVRFQAWANNISKYFTISKIAEASYGEVYRLSLLCTRNGFSKSDESVLKIVALKPPLGPQIALGTPLLDANGNAQEAQELKSEKSKSAKETKKTLLMSSIPDVASEVRLLQRMCPVPGFTRFRDITVVQGRLPTQLISAWRAYNRDIKPSLFPDPGRKNTYDEDQLWAIIEMQDAGTDVETLMEGGGDGATLLDTVEAVWDVFWGVACAVAKGEEWAEFEHRDLHLGNICVQRTKRAAATSSPTQEAGYTRKLGFTNLETTIIDYTLSRATMISHEIAPNPLPTGDMNTCERIDKSEEDEKDNASIAFYNLSKEPSIFQGDGAENYQYDIYRFMRSAVLPEAATPQHSTANRPGTKSKPRSKAARDQLQAHLSLEEQAWKQHHPLTNLVWLHFVLHELLRQERVAAAVEEEEKGKGRGRAAQLAWKLARLRDMLTLEQLGVAPSGSKPKGGFGSAADMVVWAVENQWLDEEDVVGSGAGG